MNKLDFTKKEIKALRELIGNSRACSCGCVYTEMEKSKKDCDECEFTQSINSISDKIGN